MDMSKMDAKQKARMAAMMGKMLLKNGVMTIVNDKMLSSCLGLSLAGVTIACAHQFDTTGWRTAKRPAPASKAGRAPAKGRGRVRKGPAVDMVFLKRMIRVLSIAVPGWLSQEACMLYVQAVVLVTRTLLSLRMAQLAGDGLRAVISRNKLAFAQVMVVFSLNGMAGSVVNSAIKFLTNCITVRFRTNLSKHVHDRYLSNRSYYKAAVLRQGNLDNADQRIVEDLHQFCQVCSDLFSRTFKPFLDVIFSTRRMAESMGLKGLAILYSYFLCSGYIVRLVSPSFSTRLVQQQTIEGNFRRAHNRLITNAEEIAFLNGAGREKQLLNSNLATVSVYALQTFLLQFRQGIVDQWVLKYGASVVGWPVIAVPFLMADKSVRMGERAARYREADTLIQNASASIGDLMLVYKKLQKLAGFTGRVVELLEAVDEQEAADSTPSVLYKGSSIEFHSVTIATPDGRLLIDSLSLTIPRGCNVFVSGANGAGKSSMFRVMAGLWRPQSGHVVMPENSDAAGESAVDNDDVGVFYVPQKPYLVSGSLRDQIMYPLSRAQISKSRDVDDDVCQCLEAVGLAKLLNNAGDRGLDMAYHDWTDVLSGGEKQRMALARLYFHRPRFAILDEATSAINADEEGGLYDRIRQIGVTVFSISHRESLKKFHSKHLHFVGDGTGAWTLADL